MIIWAAFVAAALAACIILALSVNSLAGTIAIGIICGLVVSALIR